MVVGLLTVTWSFNVAFKTRSKNKELRWSAPYLGEAFFVNMVHHNNLVVKRPTGPTGAAGEKHKQKLA